MNCLWFVTIKSQRFILTCSNFFFTYANVKHFQVFNFVGCCRSAFLLQCVKATSCLMCCLEIITILFFSICAIIKTWFSYLVPICYYLFFASFFIFSFFHISFLQNFVICVMFYLFPFMCRFFWIVFCCFVIFSSWNLLLFQFTKLLLLFLLAYTISFFFSPCFFFFQYSIMMNQFPKSLTVSIFKKLLMKLSINLHLTLMLK
jgi:hypothetical protein